MSRMNEFYQRLWELNEKLEEVAQAFSKTDLGGQDVDREFAPLLGELEGTFSKIVELIRRKRGLPELVFPLTSNEDVKWILGIPGAKEPKELERLRKRGRAG